MRKFMRVFGVCLLLVCVLAGCGSGISQDEYNKVVAERDEYKETLEVQDSERLKKAKESLSLMDGMAFSESENGKYIALTITIPMKVSDENINSEFEEIGSAIANLSKEDWFDYDYVFLDVWNGNTGLIVSMQVDVKTLETKAREWYAENYDGTANVTSNKEETTIESNSDWEVGNIEVVGEYWYVNSIGSANYFLIVKNNTSETVEIFVSAQAKDAEGKLIGASDGEVEAVPSGYETCVLCYFSDCENVSSFEYSISSKEDEYYEDVIQNVTYEESRTDNKVIISATNNGEKPVKFCEAYALFFKDGKLVDSDYTYVTDDDSELKANATITKELDCYGGYDDVKVYFTGRY